MAWRASVPVVLAVLALLPGCGGGAPAGPSFVNSRRTIQIEGPGRVAPGGTAAYRAWLSGAAQPRQDVTERASWRSDRPEVATVEAGRVAGVGVGEAFLEASLDGAVGVASLRVVPDGTFALTGTVRPFGSQLRARVEVTGGAGPPVSAETNDLGVYRLLGVGGRVRVTARMDGFVSRTSEIDVSGDTMHDITLSLDAQARPWRLTVTAARECGAEPGAEFAADVSLLVRAPVVLLSPVDEPTLVFYGRLESDRLTMLLAGLDDGWDYYPPGVRLRSASGAETVALGRMLASSSSSEFTGRLQGYLSGLPVQGAFCYSDLHQITLRERRVSP
jgi:hypothetical protein